MNNTAHIIQDEWLLSYAAGNLSPARSLLIASQMAYHEPVQEKVADAELIGGALLNDAVPASVDSSMLDSLLRRLEDQPGR